MSTVQSSISGKVAIITGASSGIGTGVAVNFASQGCRVTLTGRNLTNLELTKSQCIEQGLAADSILIVQADMMNNDDIKRIADTTVEKFNQIDILINNAGIAYFDVFADLPMKKYHEIMQVNVHSVVYLTKLCVPFLEKTTGSIVNVSSMSSIVPNEMIWAYTMSKAALDQFCRSLSLDLGPKGIRVNNVNPAVIAGTDIIIRTGFVDAAQYEALLEHNKDTHALGRVGEVSEVASVISFLVSDKAEQSTGCIALIDGGRTEMVYNLASE